MFNRFLLRQRKLKLLLRREPVKVNLGCGYNIQKDYINIDLRGVQGVDLVADIEWCFKHLAGKCHEVYLSHVLEHFGQPGKAMRTHDNSVLGVLQGVNNMLVSGGVIRIAVPDFRALAQLYLEHHFPLYPRILGRLCGEQDYPENLHKCVFDRNFLEMCLTQTGFKNIETWEPETLHLKRDGSYDNLDDVRTSLNLVAVKK